MTKYNKQIQENTEAILKDIGLKKKGFKMLNK